MPSLILLRGLPGAGKSTLATLLSENNKYPVFSVDDYFTNRQTGDYQFIFSENHLAYRHCQDSTEHAMKLETEKIFVDNTFTLDWELEPYFKLAKQYGYLLFVTTVENYHEKENIHGIDKEQLIKMAAKYKVKLL